MNIKERIKETNGKFFSVTFTKKDGTTREMNCRLGVTKHLKGGTSNTAHKANLVTVYDLQAEGYRCINLDTVSAFNGEPVEVAA